MQLLSTLILVVLSALGLYSATTQPSQVAEPTIMATTTARVVGVIDGDTIDVLIGSSTTRTRVRYIGIDTPEPYSTKVPECGSDAATSYNKSLVDGKTVTLVPGVDSYDTYGRMLAYVYAKTDDAEIFVNEQIVTAGFARVMMISPNTVYESSFRDYYKKARINKLGIWSTCD